MESRRIPPDRQNNAALPSCCHSSCSRPS
ncbi:unnamed protein product [Ectocarpus sp. CCAP 1310/34]|nr:unnamed protein product [Ectocarpus sp. CCAP 1310/34]